MQAQTEIQRKKNNRNTLRQCLGVLFVSLILTACSQGSDPQQGVITEDKLSAPFPKAMAAILLTDANLIVDVIVDGDIENPRRLEELVVDTASGTYSGKVPDFPIGRFELSLVYSVDDPTLGIVKVVTTSGITVTVVANQDTAIDFSSAIFSYFVSGVVTGLSGNGLVIQNNSGDDLTIAADGSFTFSLALSDGNAYVITVLTQPVNPAQTCVVTNSSGEVNGRTVSDVGITCGLVDTTPPVITLNGSDPTLVPLNGVYTEEGASATDDRDDSVSVIVEGDVDTSTLGSYTLTYRATDTAGNTAVLTRTARVFSNDFITTWKTDNSGVSDSNQITIRTEGSGYNYTIDWGDGQEDSNVTGNKTHTYAAAGTYTVSIKGDFPRIVSGPNSDAQKLLSIENWGNIKWQSMNSAFSNCGSLEGNASDTPDLSGVTNMAGMFRSANTFNQPLNDWDVSAVTNMSQMFNRASVFNQDLSSWDVSAVTDMSAMFSRTSVFNQDLSSWNVSAVTDMSSMFFEASVFNQPLNDWNVSAVTDMSLMFNRASVFNQDLSSWDVSKVTMMPWMFREAIVFNQDLSSWDVSAVIDMSGMFNKASVFNQDLGSWDVSSVTMMPWVFDIATAFNQNLGSWDISAVTDMRNMFVRAPLSVANYDALLIGWSARCQRRVELVHQFGAGNNNKYSSTSQAARDTLTDSEGCGWIVTDGGVVP